MGPRDAIIPFLQLTWTGNVILRSPKQSTLFQLPSPGEDPVPLSEGEIACLEQEQATQKLLI